MMFNCYKVINHFDVCIAIFAKEADAILYRLMLSDTFGPQMLGKYKIEGAYIAGIGF
jgi:hypothetical protein